MKNPNLFRKAIHAFDDANQQDPNKETVDGEPVPKELIYGRRMSQQLDEITPDASEELKLAVRCQHLERWKIPRNNYPKTRRGYHTWRNDLKKYHAKRAGEILDDVGYKAEIIDRVQELVQKKRIKTDPEAQLMEDVICLVFLNHYFADFSEKHPDEKIIKILRKTWEKMSKDGHNWALNLDLSDEVKRYVKSAGLVD